MAAASGFSGAVRLVGLDDHITPSQACVKPVQAAGGKDSAVSRHREADGSVVEIHSDGSRRKLPTAKISLQDCLACSGCVTSAESVLIEQMNIAAMLAAVAAHKAAGGTVVLSTTSQTVTALAVSLDMPQLECLAKLKTFFHSVGVDYVLDVAAARLVTNAETAQEFMERVTFEGGSGVNGVLSSTCPGWVCYVEKSQPSALPYLSTVRSPQAIQGVIVKTILARAIGAPSSRVFHCTLMPCFDKKLEAMRLQFAPDNIPDVDLVVTPLELLSHLQEEGITLAALQPSPPLYGVPAVDSFTHRASAAGVIHGCAESSGGLAKHAFEHVALHKFGMRVVADFVKVKNSDHREATLLVGGQVVLRASLTYGFRNIQNLIRSIKGQKSIPHFVEVMACPSGCLNGGAQPRPPPGTDPREYAAGVTAALAAASMPDDADACVQRVYSLLGAQGVGSAAARQYFHTGFTDVQTESAVARGEDGMVNIGSSSMQW